MLLFRALGPLLVTQLVYIAVLADHQFQSGSSAGFFPRIRDLDAEVQSIFQDHVASADSDQNPFMNFWNFARNVAERVKPKQLDEFSVLLILPNYTQILLIDKFQNLSDFENQSDYDNMRPVSSWELPAPKVIPILLQTHSNRRNFNPKDTFDLCINCRRKRRAIKMGSKVFDLRSNLPSGIPLEHYLEDSFREALGKKTKNQLRAVKLDLKEFISLSFSSQNVTEELERFLKQPSTKHKTTTLHSFIRTK